jgi:toxin-antitoxin system PIN domain toxin
VSIGLLDVNALIALLWEEHPFHKTCAEWFSRAAKTGWSTCPITESGFVRILCSPAFTARPPAVHNAIGLLKTATESGSNHHFWNDDLPISVLNTRWKPPLGHKQVTDLYLLTLAIHNRGSLVTFDQRIAHFSAIGNFERGAVVMLKA